jgi:hypothetical protein
MRYWTLTTAEATGSARREPFDFRLTRESEYWGQRRAIFLLRIIKMKRSRYFLYCFILGATTLSTMVADADLETAVQTALNGSLSADHIGPARAAQLQTLLSNAPKSANAILLDLLNRQRPGARVEDMYVLKVLEFTRDDSVGAMQVLRKYLILLDQADGSEKTRHAAAIPSDSKKNNLLIGANGLKQPAEARSHF